MNFVSISIYSLVAACLVVITGIAIENVLVSLDSMLVACQHSTDVGPTGQCSCVDTVVYATVKMGRPVFLGEARPPEELRRTVVDAP
jgi:hypothetical protein